MDNQKCLITSIDTQYALYKILDVIFRENLIVQDISISNLPEEYKNIITLPILDYSIPELVFGYISSILSFIKENNIDFIIPTQCKELTALNQARVVLRSQGLGEDQIHFIMPSDDQIIIHTNKDSSVIYWQSKGFNVPELTFPWEIDETVKYILKPKNGTGSFNQFVMKGDKLKKWYYKDDESSKEIRATHICQPYINGTEYTIDMCFFQGHLLRCVPRIRTNIINGKSTSSIIDPSIEDEIYSMFDYIEGMHGIINIQIIRDKDDKLWIIDTNLRVASGYPLSAVALGNNELFKIFFNKLSGLPVKRQKNKREIVYFVQYPVKTKPFR